MTPRLQRLSDSIKDLNPVPREGPRLADAVAIIGTQDIVFGEVDR